MLQVAEWEIRKGGLLLATNSKDAMKDSRATMYKDIQKSTGIL